MATLGVFIALGGTSWAAVKIDGSQVRDGSLTGRDIRNRSLAGADLKSRTIGKKHLRKGLLASRGTRGPAGAPGARGLTGPRGPAGERGPSHGMSAQADDVVENSLETIAVLELEPGNWMFSAAGLVQNQDGLRNHADCQLSTAREQGEGLTFLAQLGTTGFIPLEADTPTTISVDAESFAITAATSQD